MKLLVTLSALLISASVVMATEPNEEVKEKVEDIKGTIVKPTTEQTQAVSKAAIRAKKLKKKHE